MSATQTDAAALADLLRAVGDDLEVVFADSIDARNQISVSVHLGEMPDVDVHHVQPSMLDSIERAFGPQATGHEDADGIVRYVTVETDTSSVTFHRR